MPIKLGKTFLIYIVYIANIIPKKKLEILESKMKFIILISFELIWFL